MIPYEQIPADHFLAQFQRIPGETYILNGLPEEVPFPFTHKQFMDLIQPEVWG